MSTSQRGQFSTSMEIIVQLLAGLVQFFWTSTFIEYDFITKHLDIYGTSRSFYETSEDFAHSLGPGFDIHSAYPEDYWCPYSIRGRRQVGVGAIRRRRGGPREPRDGARRRRQRLVWLEQRHPRARAGWMTAARE